MVFTERFAGKRSRGRRPPGAIPGGFRGRVPLRTAATWSRLVVAGAVVIAGGFSLLAPSIAAPIALAMAAAGFVAGVPHGAIDHLLATRSTRGMSIGMVAAAYAGVAAASWGLLEWTGPIALVLVVVLSAVHFGLGELEVSRQLTGWHATRWSAVAMVVAGSGALLLPLARSGDQFREVATAVSPALALLIGAAPVQIGLAVTWLVAAIVVIVDALRKGHPAVAVDVVLIGALGLLAPPLVAFAVWFGGWHALRHAARMLAVEPGSARLLAQGRTRAAVMRLVRLAALPSVAALTAVVALGWFTAAAPDPVHAIAEGIRLLLALTVPHMVVVLWLDRTSGSAGTLQDDVDGRLDDSVVRQRAEHE